MRYSVRGIKLKLEEKKVLRKVKAIDFSVILCDVSSLLIIGAGHSASPENINHIVQRYDLSITLNSAIHIFPKADFYSFELDVNNVENLNTQLSWITLDNHEKFLLKPFSVIKLSHNFWKLLVEHDHNIMSLKSRYLPGEQYTHGDKQVLKCLRAIKHTRFPMPIPSKKDYLSLISKNRMPTQWRGSLSLWLDIAHLSCIKRVGLIGTDLQGSYASIADSFKRNLQGSHAINSMSSYGREPFLDTLEYLCKHGYLKDIKFHHFHTNEKFKNLI